MFKRSLLACIVSIWASAAVAQTGVQTDFADILVDERRISSFVFIFEGKHYIPVATFEQMRLKNTPLLRSIPQCGECIEIEGFAELYKDSNLYTVFPFTDFQTNSNELSIFNVRNPMSEVSEQVYALWTNYNVLAGDVVSFSLDSNFSTPMGTLNARSNFVEDEGFTLNNMQFIHDRPIEGYQVLVGDINTQRLVWNQSSSLLGVGYFETDPFQRFQSQMMKDLKIDMPSGDEVVVKVNDREVYRGFQGAGQFNIENIFGAGLVDIEVQKGSAVSEYYQFYFDPIRPPAGTWVKNAAVGLFQEGPMDGSVGGTLSLDYGFSDSLWLSSSALLSDTDNIVGAGINYHQPFGFFSLAGGVSNSGAFAQYSYQFNTDRWRFQFGQTLNEKLLSGGVDNSLTTASLGLNVGYGIIASGRYSKTSENEVSSLTLAWQYEGFNLRASVNKDSDDTTFTLNLNYNFNTDFGNFNYSYAGEVNRLSYRLNNYKLGDTSLIGGVDVIGSDGARFQAGAVTPYATINTSYDSSQQLMRSSVNGSIVYHDKSFAFANQPLLSVGIVKANGGEVKVRGRSQGYTTANDAGIAAIQLVPYSETSTTVMPSEIAVTLDRSEVLFYPARSGAYVQEVGFTSPGVQVKSDNFRKGDILKIGDTSYDYYTLSKSFYVSDLVIGEYNAIVLRDEEALCQFTLTTSKTFSLLTPTCGVN